jgi:hypothetical protein
MRDAGGTPCVRDEFSRGPEATGTPARSVAHPRSSSSRASRPLGVNRDRLGVFRVVGLADEDGQEPAAVRLVVGDLGRVGGKVGAEAARVGGPG